MDSARQRTRRRGKTFHQGKTAGPPTQRLSLPRGAKPDPLDVSFAETVDHIWEAFDGISEENNWELPKEFDARRTIQDVLFNRYKDRKLDGGVLFAAVEYCKHIVEHDGEPDSWRRTTRSNEDVLHIIKAVINAKADLHAEASHTKGTLRAIHLAAGLGPVPVLEALLSVALEGAGDDETDNRRITFLNVRSKTEKGQDHYCPLHDAVWHKQKEATEWLLENRADPNSKNILGWTPMHIVARNTSQMDYVSLLLRARADLSATSENGENPMMAAVNGQHFPVEKFHMLAPSCQDASSDFRRYLTDISLMAAENQEACEQFVEILLGRHGKGELAENDRGGFLDGAEERRPLRFLQSVDSATARTGKGSSRALAMMAEVMEKAPRAAAMILDILIGQPYVECHEHHPLPRRANMILDGYEETMICDYQPDFFEEEDDDASCSGASFASSDDLSSFRQRRRESPQRHPSSPIRKNYDHVDGWNSLRKTLLPKVDVISKLETDVTGKRRLPCWGFDTLTNTAPPWHEDLAPMREMRNDDKEIMVEVIRFPGLLDVRVVRVLAYTEHLSLFEEKTVRAIVNCLWHRLVKHGVLCGILLDVLTLASLLLWTLLAEFWPRVPGRRLFWLIALAAGIKELCNLSYSLCVCKSLNRSRISFLLYGDVSADLVATCALVALVVFAGEDYQLPSAGWGRCVLALNVLMRWFLLTYKFRPISKVGKKIVCILKSFLPMREMLFITAVVFCGFGVAALLIKDNVEKDCDDHCAATVLMNMFKALLMGDGDGFDALTTLPGGDAGGIFTGTIIVFATVIFSVSVLNLLIAVYSNEYDRKEKQSDLLFFQERAGICFRQLMEPLWPTWRQRPARLWKLWDRWQGDKIPSPKAKLKAANSFVRTLVAVIVGLCTASALLLVELLDCMVLPGALLVVSMLLVQVVSKRCAWEHLISSGSNDPFYLWICTPLGSAPGPGPSPTAGDRPEAIRPSGDQIRAAVEGALEGRLGAIQDIGDEVHHLGSEVKLIKRQMEAVLRELRRTPAPAAPAAAAPAAYGTAASGELAELQRRADEQQRRQLQDIRSCIPLLRIGQAPGPADAADSAAAVAAAAAPRQQPGSPGDRPAPPR